MGKRFMLILLFMFLLSSCSANSPHSIVNPQPTESLWTGSYLYQELPKAEPVRFAEGFLTGRFHSSPVFSPNGYTVWWAGDYSAATIYRSEFVHGTWSKPKTVTFSEEINSYRDPFISPDGKRFYFISASPLPGEHSGGKENIWMIEIEGGRWGEPTPLPDVINQYSLHWTISVADNYNLYFAANERGKSDIYFSEYLNGEYQEPVMLDKIISSEVIEFTPNIAPDESYLLFTRLQDTNSKPYLYISFAIESGWSEPQKVENIPYCISPVVTPDRKYVIFMGGPNSVWWRDTSFVENLRVECNG